MKIDYLNEISDEVKEEIEKTASLENFSSINKNVGIFQSINNNLKWPAVTLPREDIQVMAAVNPKLTELLPLSSGDFDFIIWLGKSTPQFSDLKKIIPHELRHIEQQVKEPDAFLKDRVLNCLYPKEIPPIEKDASYFANKACGFHSDEEYDWKSEVEELFDKQKNNLKKLYEGLKKGENVAVEVEPGRGFDTALNTKEENSAALHFFEKVASCLGNEKG